MLGHVKHYTKSTENPVLKIFINISCCKRNDFLLYAIETSHLGPSYFECGDTVRLVFYLYRMFTTTYVSPILFTPPFYIGWNLRSVAQFLLELLMGEFFSIDY